MQPFSILYTCFCLLLFLPASVRAELQYFVGHLDVVVASGKACDGVRGRHQISMVINNDPENDLLDGYFGGESMTVGHLTGASQGNLTVRYPYSDATRAEGHTLAIKITGALLSGELRDRHISHTVDECNFDRANLTMKMSDNNESAQLAYQNMSNLYEAQLARSMAASFSRKGAYAEAAQFYEKALLFADKTSMKDSPKLNPYLTGLANSYMRLGRYADFNLLYVDRYPEIKDETVRMFFDGHQIHSLLQIGRSALGREEYSMALEYFRQALKLNGNNRDAISGVMSALVRSGQHDEAISFLEQTEKSLGSDSARRDVRGATALVQYQKAMKLEKSGRVAEVESALRKAIQIDPDTLQYLITLARWRHKNGNYVEADHMLKKALERVKDESSRSELNAARDKLRQTEKILTKIRRTGG